MGAILRLPDVIKKTGLSKSSIYNEIKNGSFPAQIKLTQRSSGFLESEIDDWITSRVAKRDGKVS